jgi:hypothetical protein
MLSCSAHAQNMSPLIVPMNKGKLLAQKVAMTDVGMQHTLRGKYILYECLS